MATTVVRRNTPAVNKAVGKRSRPSNYDFLRLLHSLIGDPSATGGGAISPQAGFDCSGLIYYVLTSLGFKNVPRTSEAQYAAFTHITRSQLKAGDLVFSQWPGDNASPGHVQVYVGNGMVIQSPGNSSGKVEMIPLASDAGHIVGYARIPGINHGVNTGSTPNTITLWPKQITHYGTNNMRNLTAPKNYSDNAIALLTLLGIFPDRGAIQALVSQQTLENSTGRYNPFGISHNGHIVNFHNWQEGIVAAGKVFLQPNHSGQLAALTATATYTPTCRGYANALAHGTYEGTQPSAKPANAAYGAKVASVCASVSVPKPTGYWKDLFLGMHDSGAAYGANWWDPLAVWPTKKSQPYPFGINPLSGVEAFYHAIEGFINVITSRKFWYIVLGGILMLVGLVVLFKSQISNAVQKGGKVAAVAA